MKILVVSFDRVLSEKIKEALKDFEVIVVKNSEEALNTVFSDIDVIIYDAILGAISENDINRMYKQKFRDSKYVILIDNFFPIDINNIEAPKKIAIDREKALENIVNAVAEEGTQKAFIVEFPLMHEYDFGKTVEIAEERSTVIEEKYQKEVEEKRKKILVVTFDEELIKKLNSSLRNAFDIISANNKKDILEKIPQADVVLFDAIYGSITQKILIDLSKEEYVKTKPFIILVDDLFPIDTENIPLPQKYTFFRESEYEKAINQIKNLTYAIKETPSQKEEQTSMEDLLTELLKDEKSESKGIKITEEVKTTLQETQPIVPIYKSEKEFAQFLESMLLRTFESIEGKLNEIISSSVRNAIEKLDISFVSDAISSSVSKYFENLNITNLIRDIIREEIKNIISKAGIAEIIRVETRKILKEKLEELLK